MRGYQLLRERIHSAETQLSQAVDDLKQHEERLKIVGKGKLYNKFTITSVKKLSHRKYYSGKVIRAHRGLATSERLGHEIYIRWTKDGTLVPSTEFAQRWGVSRQALAQATQRGELFSIKVGNRRFYPGVFLSLTRPFVGNIAQALRGAEPDEKLIFVLRPHGALGGRTIAEALSAGMEDRAVSLAQAWAEERGLQHGDTQA